MFLALKEQFIFRFPSRSGFSSSRAKPNAFDLALRFPEPD
jgi:hypothetical protein